MKKWLIATAICLYSTSMSIGLESCSEDVIPDLGGAWVCSENWVIKTDKNAGPFEGITTWIQYYIMPTFYAVSKIQAVPTCNIDEAMILRLQAAVWDEGMPDETENGSIIFKNHIGFNWIEFDIPAAQALSNGSQLYTGFGRRSPYWKIQLDMPESINISCLPKLMFFARAGVAATQHIVMMTHSVGNDKFNQRSNRDLLPGNPPLTDTCKTVTQVPASVVRKYRLDTSFYRKYTSAYGIPILSSYVVNNRALQRACYVVRFMLADRADIRKHMYNNKGRVAIIGRRETVPMVPEMRIFPTFNRRAAGGTFQIPVNVGAEENMLCERGDGYSRNQDIFMHEFAHGVHLIACHTALPNFNRQLQGAFLSARRRGLWRNTYANTNNQEYFAEGVQAYFNQQREGRVGGDGIQNHINTREELRTYDPNLYRIIKDLFPCLNDYIPRCNDITQTRGLAQTLTTNCRGGPKTTTTSTIKSTTEPTPTTPSTTAVSTTSPVSVISTASTRKTPTTTTTAIPTSCTDDHHSCAAWASKGECHRNPRYMLYRCKLSCGRCGTPNCQDYDNNCVYWSSYCWSNFYVKRSCRKTCRQC